MRVFHPVSNLGPFACEAKVITTTLWKQITLALDPFGTEEILESRLNFKVGSRQPTALNKRLFPPSFELGTFRVLGERDNHYTMDTDNTGPCPVCYSRDLGKWAPLESCIKTYHQDRQRRRL